MSIGKHLSQRGGTIASQTVLDEFFNNSALGILLDLFSFSRIAFLKPHSDILYTDAKETGVLSIDVLFNGSHKVKEVLSSNQPSAIEGKKLRPLINSVLKDYGLKRSERLPLISTIENAIQYKIKTQTHDDKLIAELRVNPDAFSELNQGMAGFSTMVAAYVLRKLLEEEAVTIHLDAIRKVSVDGEDEEKVRIDLRAGGRLLPQLKGRNLHTTYPHLYTFASMARASAAPILRTA